MFLLYSPFPRRRDSKCSSNCKSKSSMVKVLVSFQMSCLKRDLRWPSRISLCIPTSIWSLVFHGTGCRSLVKQTFTHNRVFALWEVEFSVTARESSLRRAFDPCAPLLFILYHYLEQNLHFGLVPEPPKVLIARSFLVDRFSTLNIPRSFSCGDRDFKRAIGSRRLCSNREFASAVVQPIPLGNAVSTLKAQGSNISFH